MFSHSFFFTCIVLFVQYEIAAVVASSAATSMLPTLSSFGNTITKACRKNQTDDIPLQSSTVDDLSHKGSKLESNEVSHQQSSLLDESKRRMWCFGPHADSKVKNQRYYLPVRFLSVLRKNDIAILPGNHAPTKEYVDFIVPLLGLSHDQIIWTSGNSVSIDADIDENVKDKIRELIITSESRNAKDSSWVLVPYCVTKGFLRWSSDLCDSYSTRDDAQNKREKSHTSSRRTRATVEIFGESESWNNKYGHKGILHRHMSDLSISSVIEDIDVGSSVTRVAKGYQCSTNEHLLEAYKLLQDETKDARAVIKPITGCAGWGILFINSAEELKNYDFPMGEVLLEEMLNLDLTEDGLVISPAVHYLGPKLFGGRLVDQLMKNTTYLGWRESKADMKFQEKVLEMTEKLLKFTQPKGPGGYDFLSVNGEPVLSDVNTGRFNGAHQPKVFLSQYAPQGSMWYCWKHKPNKIVTIDQVWSELKGANLAFDLISETGKCVEGVFPLTYLRGVDGIFIAIANSTERAFKVYQKAAHILEQLELRSVTSYQPSKSTNTIII